MDFSELIPVAVVLWVVMAVFMCIVADYGRKETKKRAIRVFVAVTILLLCWLLFVFLTIVVQGGDWETITYDMPWWIQVSVVVWLIVELFAGIALLAGWGFAKIGKPRWLVIFPAIVVPGIIFAPIIYWLA